MKASEIRALSVSEIEEKIASLSLELQKTRLAHVISPIENPMKIRQTRKNIARLKTILQQKQESEK